MQLYYKGVDIYSDIQIVEGVYEGYCSNHFNYLRVLFEDENHKMDSYGMCIDDEICAVNGSMNTGIMYVNSIVPKSTGYEIIARSVKAEEWKVASQLSWNHVTFKQIMQDVAAQYNMPVEFHGVKDYVYNKKSQGTSSDFSFIASVASLEGCVIVVHNKKIIVASERYLEEQTANSTLNVDNCNPQIHKSVQYDGCMVYGNTIKGSFKVNTSGRYINMKIEDVDSKGQAERLAMNILRHKNKMAYYGTFVEDSILDQYAAGSVLNIDSVDYKTVCGKAIVYRIRFDFAKNKSKVWFRKCLTGY